LSLSEKTLGVMNIKERIKGKNYSMFFQILKIKKVVFVLGLMTTNFQLIGGP
jgi:hypothetical protein